MHLVSDLNNLSTEIECESPKGYGLYNGTMGLSMANFIFWRQTAQIKFKRKAMSYLNETLSNIQTLDGHYDMSNGLLGFGWGMIWLVENQFIKLNINNFLEDLDDAVYKMAVYDDIVGEKQNIDRADVMLYLMNRTNNKSITTQSFYRRVCHVECIKIFMDKLCESVYNADEMYKVDIVFYNKLLLLFNRIKETKAYTDNILLQETFKKLSGYLTNDMMKKHTLTSIKRKKQTNTKNAGDVFFDNLQMSSTFLLLRKLDSRNKYKWKEAWYL